MAFSSAGKKKFTVYALLILLDIAVLALAANYAAAVMADLFPFVLSIITLVILLAMLGFDLALKNSFTAKPPFEIAMMYVLTVFWLAFNAFSTMRWRFIPLDCNSIPSDYADERVWCRDVQGLKSLVWIQFLALFFTASFILRFAIVEHRKGNRHVWTTPISRFRSRLRQNPAFNAAFERSTITDYFGTTDFTQQPQSQPWEKF